MSTPLADVLARLDRDDEEMAYRLGDPGPGWLRLDALDAAVLDGIVAAVLAEEGDHRDVAGSYAASWVASAVVASAAAPLVLERRSWALDGEGVWLHQHEDGWFGALAVAGPLRVVAGDPLAGRASAGEVGIEVLPTVEALRARWAAEAVAVLHPVITHLATTTRFGRPGMWGSVADSVAGHAVWLANARDVDHRLVWAEAMALVEALAAHVRIPTRPTPFAVPWSGGVQHMGVRGTCCLAYKPRPDADPDGEGYCSSCPLRTDASRVRRVAGWLDQLEPADA